MAEDEGVNAPIDILLVEPNPGDTRLFTESFDEAQLTNTLHTVSDGETALDVLHQRGDYADGVRPDLIILEPQLPRKSGMEVLAELNEEPVLREIPVVVLASSEMGEEIVKSHVVDADQYVQKPVEPEDYLEFVREIEELSLAIVEE